MFCRLTLARRGWHAARHMSVTSGRPPGVTATRHRLPEVKTYRLHHFCRPHEVLSPFRQGSLDGRQCAGWAFCTNSPKAADTAEAASAEQARAAVGPKSEEAQQVVQWMQDVLLHQPERARRVYEAHHSWLRAREIDESYNPRIKWLQDRLKLKNENMARKFASRNINVFALETADIEASLKALEAVFRCDEQGVIERVAKCPRLVGVAGKDAKDVMHWLQQRLKLDAESIRTILKRQPGLLLVSVPERLEPMVAWMEEEMKLSLLKIAQLFNKYPSRVGSCTHQTLEAKHVWLEERLGLDRKQSAAIFANPRTTFLTMANLKAKVDFFVDDLRAPRDHVAGVLLEAPFILAFDLDGRIRPRVEQFREEGLTFDFIKHALCVTQFSDDKFKDTVRKLKGRRDKAAEMQRRAEVRRRHQELAEEEARAEDQISASKTEVESLDSNEADADCAAAEDGDNTAPATAVDWFGTRGSAKRIVRRDDDTSSLKGKKGGGATDAVSLSRGDIEQLGQALPDGSWQRPKNQKGKKTGKPPIPIGASVNKVAEMRRRAEERRKREEMAAGTPIEASHTPQSSWDM